MLTVFVLLNSLVLFCNCCDLYVASKCPQSPAINDHNLNSTVYCKMMKDHVDCINKKLKLCKNIQEYGPALETIKWSLKVIIAQAVGFGCPDISDLIKLPRTQMRTPSTRATTTTVPTTTTTYINPNCSQSYVDLSCRRFDNTSLQAFSNKSATSTLKIDEISCKAYYDYSLCLKKNFKIRCQYTLRDIFSKFDKTLSNCKSESSAWLSNRISKQSSSNCAFELSLSLLQLTLISIGTLYNMTT